MITLKNDILSIKVDRHGAELWSIRDHSGREFIWQADPAFWKRHAPVLFPIVGSLWDFFGRKYIVVRAQVRCGNIGKIPLRIHIENRLQADRQQDTDNVGSQQQ